MLGQLLACWSLPTILILGRDSKAMQPIYLHCYARGPSNVFKRSAFRLAKRESHETPPNKTPTPHQLLAQSPMTFNSWRMCVFRPNPTALYHSCFVVALHIPHIPSSVDRDLSYSARPSLLHVSFWSTSCIQTHHSGQLLAN